MSRRPFNAFEVHLVGEFPVPYEGTGHYAETIESKHEYDEVKDSAHAVYFTVYGYRGWQIEGKTLPNELEPDGGAEAIADFPNYTDALDLAYALADGKPVTDMVPEGLENYREAAEREAQPTRSDGLPTPKTPDPGMRGPW